MEQLVQHTLIQQKLVRPGARVICALSGGADSIAMTHLLCRLGKQMGFTVSACHLNHQLRGEESWRDERLVREFCRRQHIGLTVARRPIDAYAEEHRLGLEEAAREVRYAFFSACREKENADWVATAHTADDQLETMLFQLIRGSGLRGMCGIPEKREYFIRPMLRCTRQQIHQYMERQRLPFCHDSSNDDLTYHRNRIRAQVLPVLQQINPQATAHAAKSAEFLREDERFLTALAQEQRTRLMRETTFGCGLDLAGYRRLPLSLQYRLMRQLLGEQGVVGTAAQLDRILDMCRKNNGQYQTYSLMEGRRVVLQSGLLLVETVQDNVDSNPVGRRLTLGQTVSFGRWQVTIRPAETDEIYNCVNLFGVCRDTIDFATLQVRGRRAGDRMQRHAGGGHKKLSRLMIDLKIPLALRDTLPVIADRNGIIAVAGVGVNQDRLSLPTVDMTIEIKETKR